MISILRQGDITGLKNLLRTGYADFVTSMR
jgi:hypothetical protein